MTGRILAAWLVAILGAGVCPADTFSLTLNVDGMVCQMCTLGVKKRLHRTTGIARVTEVDLNTGRVRLSWDSRIPLSYDGLTDAVRDAGYSLAGLSLEAEGVLAPAGNGWRLEIIPGNAFILAGRLPPGLAAGMRARAGGRLVPSSRRNESATLQVDSLAPVHAPPD